MSFRLLPRPPRRTNLGGVIAAYAIWRCESAAVQAAYRAWLCAPPSSAFVAFEAYWAALDREERAAGTYARLLHRARRRPGIDLVRQLAQLTPEAV